MVPPFQIRRLFYLILESKPELNFDRLLWCMRPTIYTVTALPNVVSVVNCRRRSHTGSLTSSSDEEALCSNWFCEWPMLPLRILCCCRWFVLISQFFAHFQDPDTLESCGGNYWSMRSCNIWQIFPTLASNPKAFNAFWFRAICRWFRRFWNCSVIRQATKEWLLWQEKRLIRITELLCPASLLQPRYSPE